MTLNYMEFLLQRGTKLVSGASPKQDGAICLYLCYFITSINKRSLEEVIL